MKYPGRPAINLEEAVDLMNKVIAEEVELKKDSIALEQTMQGLTMTVVPRSSQVAAPAAAPIPQTQYAMMAQMAQQLNTLTNQTTVAPTSQPPNTSKKQSKKNDLYTCILCEGDSHDAETCKKFPTPKDKIGQLQRKDACVKCALYKGECRKYGCKIYGGRCKACTLWHYGWLCPVPKQQTK